MVRGKLTWFNEFLLSRDVMDTVVELTLFFRWLHVVVMNLSRKCDQEHL